MSQPTTPNTGQQPTLAQPVPAQPPSRLEIERKLSFRSATSTRQHESPKKKKPSHPPPPHAGYYGYPSTTSGNESDSSSITSSTQPPQTTFVGSPNPTSPILTPATTSVGGLSAIAERNKFGGEVIDEMELEDVEEEAEGEGEGEGDGDQSGSEADEGLEGLERGMEGERVIKSGYLWKKQERRKAWKKRWFVLRTGKIAYYKDEKEYSLKRVVDLHDVHTVAPVTVKKHPHSFGMVTPKRTFFAKGSSSDDIEEWVRAINGVRRKLSEREEEERSRREKSEHQHHVKSTSIPIPSSRERTNEGTMDTTSPTGSYFVHRPIASSQIGSTSPALGSGNIHIPPSSPLDTTNSLTSQMAKMTIPNQTQSRNPSSQSQGQAPASHLISPRIPSSATSLPPSRSVSGAGSDPSGRREPSAGSIGSSGDRNISANLNIQSNQAVSSEDEDDIDLAESNQDIVNQQNLPSTPIDPNKVILSAYLMKRSKGRGRKVWRKRWFVLTSQGVTYTKSHMDTRALRFIPLTSILDALEVDASDPSSGTEDDQPPSAHPHNHNPFHPHAHNPANHPSHAAATSTSPPSKQNFTTAMRGRLSSNDGMGAGGAGGIQSSSTPKKTPSQAGNVEKHGEENTFRLITAKRTYVLCAPSEEDEIKWLAATRALLNQIRGKNNSVPNAGMTPASPTLPQQPQQTQNQKSNVSFITQQPPTPAASISENQSQTQAQGQTQSGVSRSLSRTLSQKSNSTNITLEKELPQPQSIQRQYSYSSQSGSPGQNTRGRSATYMAKSAVADVVKKFHPES
ncbi:uncharacterized protein IL334_004561 [Kwoniella shivajii]|uniref:PH domain-containing protein n=1 Tax=Kwoniella shivajii TaxID=564305 RepID=A0ABZ1D219_9TREE|nr:hypothetical protein IL334_004561 [Kwoniella shivajii]